MNTDANNNTIDNIVRNDSSIPPLTLIEKSTEEKLRAIEEKKKMIEKKKNEISFFKKTSPYVLKFIWYIFVAFCIFYTIASITSSLSEEYREILRKQLFYFFFPNGKME